MKTNDSSNGSGKTDRTVHETPSWAQVQTKGVMLRLRVSPRSSRNALLGEWGDALKICLRAPPQDGKANSALLDFLSELLQVPKNHIDIISGAAGKTKRILIQSGNAPEIVRKINDAIRD